MLSPIGVRALPLPGEERDWQERFKNRPGKGPPRWVRYFASYTWDKKITAFSVGRLFGKGFQKKFINRYVSKR